MLEVAELEKEYKDARRSESAAVKAVRGISFTAERGEMFTLLGPSGCGKTTTLRCIAGLERPTGGRIAVAGRVLSSSADRTFVPASERRLGMVFQSYAIWPHMTVFENAAFPLRVQARKERVTRSDITERVDRVLEAVGLLEVARRQATDLSGGQQQRLALARALVVRPALLLLDEPLSNLDAKLRESMRFELKRLQRDLEITTIYVTHDQVEALSMASRIAVMRNGRIVQIGNPRQIYGSPNSRFVAEFIGSANVVPGRVRGQSGDMFVETAGGDLRVDDTHPVGSDVVVVIRPENMQLLGPDSTPSAPAAGIWSGDIETRAFLGETVDHVLRVGEFRFRVRTSPRDTRAPGGPVDVHIPVGGFHVLPDD